MESKPDSLRSRFFISPTDALSREVLSSQQEPFRGVIKFERGECRRVGFELGWEGKGDEEDGMSWVWKGSGLSFLG